jgi:hypothetical protein
MSLLPLRLSGLISNADMPAFDCPPEFWNIAQEVHFRQAPAERVQQARIIYGLSLLNSHPLHLRNSYFQGTNSWVVGVGTGLLCCESDGSAWEIISEAGNVPATTVANNWTSCELNGIPVINYGKVPVYWLRDPLTASVSLPDWPAGSTCKVIRAYKNYLIALNVNDGTDDFPSLIKWSDAAEPGLVPASWTAGATTDAGEFSAAGVNEGITDGLVLRDTFMVYKPHAAFVVQYVGGNAIMAIRQLSDSMGCLAANCVAELNGTHIMLGQGDVYITDGQSIRSLVSQKVREDLFSRMDTQYFYESYVVAYPSQNEVWICVPELGETYATLALVYHASTDSFSYRSIKYGNAATGGCPHLAFGNIGETLSGETTWASRTTNWNTDSSNWNTLAQIPALNGLVGCKLNDTSGSGLLQLDAQAGVDTTLSNRPVSLVKYGMDLGDRETVKYISEIWPRITGIAGTELFVQVGGQMEPDDDPVWSAVNTYTIGSTKKIDCRFSARFLAIAITSVDLGTWRMTGMDVKAVSVSRY